MGWCTSKARPGRRTSRARRCAPCASSRANPLEIGPYRMQGLPTPAGIRRCPARGAGAAAGDFRRVRGERAYARLPGPHQATAGLVLGHRGAAHLPAGARRRGCCDLPWRDMAVHSALGDRFWNPGPLILAHQPIEARCAVLPRGRLRACEGPRLPRMPYEDRPPRGSGAQAGGVVRRRALRDLPPRPQGHQDHPPRRRRVVRRLPSRTSSPTAAGPRR